MRAKRTSTRIAVTMIFTAALVSPAVVSPASFHDMGIHAAHSTTLASSTTPNASPCSFHDM
jgi:hypothetical protein